METFDIVIAVVAVVLVIVATARTDPRINAVFTVRTMGLFALYMGYCVIAVLIVFYILRGAPVGMLKAAAGMVFVLAWIGFGVLWLIRYVPKLKQPPTVLKKPFGPLGLGFIAAAAAGITVLLLDF